VTPRLRADYCQYEARRLVGAPVKVIVDDMGPDVAGRASHDGDGWVIRLSPRLLADAKHLALTFWHECEHLRLGHVGTTFAQIPNPPAWLRAIRAADAPAKEDTADAYAAQRWAALGEHALIVADALFLEDGDDGRT
jgi:hypothetical protein